MPNTDENYPRFVAALIKALSALPPSTKADLNRAAVAFQRAVDWRSFANEHVMAAKLVLDIEEATDQMTLDKQRG